MRRGLISLLLALWAVWAPGCKQPEGPVPGMEHSGMVLSEAALRGRAVFRRQKCATCHIRGGPPPSAFLGAQQVPLGRRIGPILGDVGGRYTDAWHLAHLRDPAPLRPGSTMPAYPWLFGERGAPLPEAVDLVAYLQAQRDPAVDRTPTLDVKVALGTSPSDGPAVFARNCAGCHGEDGDGTGAGGRGANPAPRDLTRAGWKFVPWSEDGRPDRKVLMHLLVRGMPGTLMPGAQLTPADLAAVVEHTRGLAPSAPPSLPPAFSGGDDSERGRAAGRGLYATLGCGKCHGLDARGTPQGPDLIGGPSKADPGPESVAGLIWWGIPGTTMPSYSSALAPRGPGRPPLDALVGWVRHVRAQGP